MSDEQRGVVFPAAGADNAGDAAGPGDAAGGAAGRRSTSALGRAVVADALRPVDPAGALAAAHETNWRSGYLTHFRRLIEAGLASRAAALDIASAGLAALHDRMRVVPESGPETGLDELLTAPAGRRLGTVEVPGGEPPDKELALPYRGDRLTGDALARRLDAWVTAGIMEPSAAEAVRTVQANPDWLRLGDHTVVVLGAGAEIGPLPSLLRWGARVAAVDLTSPAIWERVLGLRSAGTLVLPVAGDTVSDGEGTPLARRTGADLVADVPAVADWVAGLGGRLVLGNYVYADGATNVRVSTAVDALTVRLQRDRDGVALAFLATPTDVFAVPGAAVEHSARAYADRSVAAKLAGRPLRTLSAGRLLRRGYLPGTDPGINDSLVAQQGPNYALAKRLQRWRAAVARDAGTTVSLNVAPPTRTRSVLKNRALAAAYAGAHRFGVEAFEPATTTVLMAALLVHDLHVPAPQPHPWQDEAHAAVHGGLWRTPYAPRSALGLAALLGYGAARS